MTGAYIESCMVEVAQKMRHELYSKHLELGPGEKTAAKAYHISISIIDQATKMVIMKFSDKAYDEKYYSVREQRIFHDPRAEYFIDRRKWFYQEQDTASKEAFLVYAHAVQMVRSTFYDTKKNELTVAKQANAVEKIFECNMVIDTLTDLLEQWEELWEAKGVTAHEGQ